MCYLVTAVSAASGARPLHPREELCCSRGPRLAAAPRCRGDVRGGQMLHATAPAAEVVRQASSATVPAATARDRRAAIAGSAAASARAPLSLAPAPARAPASAPAPLENQAAPLQTPLAPLAPRTRVPVAAKSGQAAAAAGEAAQDLVPAVVAGALPRPRPRKCVRIDLSACTEHEITPYSEVYGIHPRDFAFERNGFVVLLAPGTGHWLRAATITHALSYAEWGDSDEEDDVIVDDGWVLMCPGL